MKCLIIAAAGACETRLGMLLAFDPLLFAFDVRGCGPGERVRHRWRFSRKAAPPQPQELQLSPGVVSDYSKASAMLLPSCTVDAGCRCLFAQSLSCEWFMPWTALA